MPAYLAPGVFVEELSLRAKSIEGVSTSTAGFVGPCRYGPVVERAGIVTSLAEFERSHGDGQGLGFASDGASSGPNFVWQAARAFFEEGGKRLYIARVFQPLAGTYPSDLAAAFDAAPHADGHGRRVLGPDEARLRLVARYPGAAGNMQVQFRLQLGRNVLNAMPDPNAPAASVPAISHLQDGDVVWISSAVAFPASAPTAAPPAPRTVDQLPIYVARQQPDGAWLFEAGGLRPGNPPLPAGPSAGLDLAAFAFKRQAGAGDSIRLLSLSMEIRGSDGLRSLGVWGDLPMDPQHPRGGVAASIFDRFGLTGSGTASLPIVLLNEGITTGIDLLKALATLPGLSFQLTPAEWADAGARDEFSALRRKLERGLAGNAELAGGNDGLLPDATPSYRKGFQQFESIDDIAIVAAPGCTWAHVSRSDEVHAVTDLLIAHAEKMRKRIALVDPPEAMTIAEIRKFRARFDSSFAALYYPWVTVLDPITGQRLNLPPSGFVAGIYARNDTERAVYKAPANELVRSAVGFETPINKTQQEVLNPEGINAFRFFEGRGLRLWGARTISADPEWKYVNRRRYFAYLEHSIDQGTQWVVFEPQGEALWAQVRASIGNFLINEWSGGALLGETPEKAFFVRCDRSTMTQNDLDNGRLVCLVGVAPFRPGEFVILRIGQWTADHKSRA